MRRYLIIGFAALGFSASAAAQEPADVTAILENLQPAAEDLAAGLEGTATTLAETQSAVATSAALGDAVVTSGSTLVQGAPTLGSLGLGLTLGNAAVQTNVGPFLTLIDDPSQESLDNVFNPDDLSTIAANLEDTPEPLIDGRPGLGNAGLRDAGIALLEGQLHRASQGGLFGPVSAADTLFTGTNYGQGGANFAGTPGIVGLVFLTAAQDPMADAEESLAPVFDAAAPVTGPVIDAIEDAGI